MRRGGPPKLLRNGSWLWLIVALGAGCAQPVAPLAEPPAAPGQLLEIVARGLDFEAPARAASGWTTLRLVNESGMAHFALLQRLPEGIGIADHQAEVAPVFQRGMDRFAAGDREGALAHFADLPAWYADVVFLGGPGLVTAGRSTQVTMLLEPGRYLLECYVKTGGRFHSYRSLPGTYGMVHELVVDEGPARGAAPDADVLLTISRAEGIEVVGELAPGAHRVAVHFADQAPHGNFVGHDVHLARLDEDSSLPALADWMDWRQPRGLETPAPVVFVGGVNEMPAGSTAYLDVQLEPGRYAWVAEVDGPHPKGMLRLLVVR